MVVSIWKTVGPAKLLAKATMKALLGPKAIKTNPVLKSRMTSCLRNFSDHEQMIKVVDCMLLNPQDVRNLLPSITAPILFIVGEDDSLNPPRKHMEHVSKSFKNPPPVVVVENSGHLSPLDHPKEFAAATSKFLAVL